MEGNENIYAGLLWQLSADFLAAVAWHTGLGDSSSTTERKK